ncbi:MAG: hypothetical protein AB7K71_03960 [Polyangiaceae bacterium]
MDGNQHHDKLRTTLSSRSNPMTPLRGGTGLMLQDSHQGARRDPLDILAEKRI